MEPELLTAYIALLTMAVIPIFFGSYRSLNPSSTIESISSSDAMMFPVFGSAGLFGLYLLFKFLSKEWINFVFSTYYGFIGIGTISSVLSPVLSSVLPYHLVKKKSLISFKIWIPMLVDSKIELGLVDIIGLSMGSVVGVVYFLTKNWIANNIFGECISIVAIEFIALNSYWVGAILLIGLFFYDIFWVFGTDVMETVARSFEAPIKVLWPRGEDFSLLGLGDIVIPGLFISLMLKFDNYLEKKKKRNYFSRNSSFYFTVSFIAYILSLVVTVAVLHVFKHGQPALLYIVPFLLVSTFVAALMKGELKELLYFHIEEKKKDEEKKEDKKDEEKKEDKKDEEKKDEEKKNE